MVFLHFGRNVPRISSSVKRAETRMDQHGQLFGGKREREKTAQMCESVISS
jgi:hypothetical protein